MSLIIPERDIQHIVNFVQSQPGATGDLGGACLLREIGRCPWQSEPVPSCDNCQHALQTHQRIRQLIPATGDITTLRNPPDLFTGYLFTPSAYLGIRTSGNEEGYTNIMNITPRKTS